MKVGALMVRAFNLPGEVCWYWRITERLRPLA